MNDKFDYLLYLLLKDRKLKKRSKEVSSSSPSTLAGGDEEPDMNEGEIIKCVKNFGDENFKEQIAGSKKYKKKPIKIPLNQRVIMLKREMKEKVD